MPDPLDETDLRLRAAWLYYGHGLTQLAVADRLGLSRSKVLRLLEEVRNRQEVRIWVNGGPGSSVALGVDLQAALDVNEVIVVPGTALPDEGGTRAVGMALGSRLTRCIDRAMLIGVGWGRTLHASLPAFAPRQQADCRVVSLMGGSVDPDLASAFEYPWRFASRLGAECQLFPAPVVVETPEVRRSLLEASGMGLILDLGRNLDMAIYSVGDVGANGSSLSHRLIPPGAYDEMVADGAVADVMCQFIDASGQDVDHPIRNRLMSLPLDDLARARIRVLASAGASRGTAIAAAVRRTRPTILVIDEAAALELQRITSDRAVLA
ncbi:MAG: sugar-binding domain-containing protein [Pseudomonadota bacterium]